jgi:hypothetical protein
VAGGAVLLDTCAGGIDGPAGAGTRPEAGILRLASKPITRGTSFRLIEDAGFEILPEMLRLTSFVAGGVFPRNVCR